MHFQSMISFIMRHLDADFNFDWCERISLVSGRTHITTRQRKPM